MLTTFGFLDVPELGIILVIALVIFGPGKLPEIGKSLGKGIAEFKNATGEKTAQPKEETAQSKEEKNEK